MKLLEGMAKTKNYSEIIIDRILESLAKGELQPGDKLPPEEQFAERLGVGRNSVREAVNILKAFGIVEVRRASGTYIAEEFCGPMATSAVYGMLLKAHHAADLAQLKVKLQEMVLLTVMEKEQEAELERLRHAICVYQKEGDRNISEQEAFLRQFELSVGQLTENPMICHLFAETVKCCAWMQTLAISRKVETGNASWFLILYQELLEAIQAQDRKKLLFLMKTEEQALVSSFSTKCG